MHKMMTWLLAGMILSAAAVSPDAASRAPSLIPGEGIDTAAIIKQIRAQFNEINAGTAHYRRQKRELSTDFSSEGGSMERFYDSSKKLRKIVCETYGAIGRTHEEYYVRNDSLFFAFIKDFVYNEPISVNMNPKIRETTESRYYLYQANIIQWLEGKQKKRPAEFSKMSKKLLDVFERYARIP